VGWRRRLRSLLKVSSVNMGTQGVVKNVNANTYGHERLHIKPEHATGRAISDIINQLKVKNVL